MVRTSQSVVSATDGPSTEGPAPTAPSADDRLIGDDVLVEDVSIDADVRGLLIDVPSRPTTSDGTLGDGWQLSPELALRPESFGALAYHFGTRRLSFLKSPQLVTVVRSLADHPTALAACRAAGVGEQDLPRYGEALRTLADAGTIVARPGESPRPLAPAVARSGDVGSRTSPAKAPATATPRVTPAPPGPSRLVERFESGLAAPICLTWELTYACNLACVHCLSSSGRRDPRELTTAECKAVIDELERMQVFYVNIGGGEPTIRPDFWELLDYATAHHVGVKFSTNGVADHPAGGAAGWPPATTSTCRSRSTARPPRSTTPSAAPGPTRPRCAAMEQPGRGRVRRTSRSRWWSPGTTSPSSTSSRPSPTGSAPSCG